MNDPTQSAPLDATSRTAHVERALDRLLVVFLFGAGFSIVVEQTTAILAGLVWLVDVLYRRRRPCLPLLWPIVAFFAAAFISSLAALEPWWAFRQLKSEWVPLLLIFVVANRPLDHAAAARRVGVMTVVGGLMALVGLGQALWYGSSFRVEGTLGHYMTYSGVLLLLGLPLLASLLFRRPGGALSRNEIVRVVVLVAMAVALILTQTRGAWLAALAGLTVLVLSWRARWLVALPVVALVAFLLAPQAARARIADLVNLQDVTAIERVYMWRAAANMARDHPLTGLGLDNFWLAIDEYRLPGDPWLGERKLMHAHSNPFMLAAERGVLGLGTWIALWVAWLVLVVKIWRALPPDERVARGVIAGSAAALTAFHVAGLTEYTWGDTEVAYLAAYVMGTGIAYTRIGAHESHELGWGREQ